jgi:hypothetical protein
MVDFLEASVRALGRPALAQVRSLARISDIKFATDTDLYARSWTLELQPPRRQLRTELPHSVTHLPLLRTPTLSPSFSTSQRRSIRRRILLIESQHSVVLKRNDGNLTETPCPLRFPLLAVSIYIFCTQFMPCLYCIVLSRSVESFSTRQIPFVAFISFLQGLPRCLHNLLTIRFHDLVIERNTMRETEKYRWSRAPRDKRSCLVSSSRQMPANGLSVIGRG